MSPEDRKLWRAARRARAMADAETRATWSGGGRRIPNKRKEASRKACRQWRYEA